MSKMEFLSKYLPSGYIYEVEKIWNVKEEKDEFSCEIRCNINSEEIFSKWKDLFETKSFTRWNVRSSSSCNQPNSRYLFSKDLICCFNEYNKTDGSRRSNLGCNATLKVRIKKNSRFVQYRDKFVKKGLCGIIKIDFLHNHHLYNKDNLKFLRPSEDTVNTFREYYCNGKYIRIM